MGPGSARFGGTGSGSLRGPSTLAHPGSQHPVLAETPRHITVAELDSEQALPWALPESEKLLPVVIRMIAYRAETRMMPAVAQARGRKQRPRRHLRALLQADADILPEPERGILHILGTASNADDYTIAGLLKELDLTRTIFPGINLRMVYELPG